MSWKKRILFNICKVSADIGLTSADPSCVFPLGECLQSCKSPLLSKVKSSSEFNCYQDTMNFARNWNTWHVGCILLLFLFWAGNNCYTAGIETTFPQNIRTLGKFFWKKVPLPILWSLKGQEQTTLQMHTGGRSWFSTRM
jgi:hypothetical protein